MEDRNDQNQEKENELPSETSNRDVAAGDRPHAANPYRSVST